MDKHKVKPGVQNLFGDDSDDDQHQHATKPRAARPIDPQVQDVADKLAEFCAKNGRHYEDLTRDRNPGNTPFKFLWDKASIEYKYYENKLNSLLRTAGPAPPPAAAEGHQETSRHNGHRHSSTISLPAAPLAHEHQRQEPHRGSDHSSDRYCRSSHADRHRSRDRYHRSSYYYSDRERSSSGEQDRHNSSEAGRYNSRDKGGHLCSDDKDCNQASNDRHHQDRQPSSNDVVGSDSVSQHGRKRTRWETESTADAVAAAGPAAATAAGGTRTLSAMDEYMRKLDEAEKQKRKDEEEEEERRKRAAMPLLKETAFDRRKVVAVFRDDGQRGHHMDDFIPKEELAKFMAKCGDTKLQQQVEAQSAIGADNIGHKLLQKMGWKEGKGIGAKEHGQTAPVAAAAAGVAQDKLGLGAQAHGAVEESDDPFEQYRKRMMLGYKYRPNPLGNPRRPYY